MPMVVSNKQRINFAIEGERGPFLVLHHGLFGSHRDWYEWGYVRALVNDFRLILLDARGHGRSDRPATPEAYRQSLWGDDVVAVLDDLDIRNVNFFGYSLGALVGFDLMNRHAGRVRSAVLGGGPPFVTPGAVEGWGALAARLRTEPLDQVVNELRESGALACTAVPVAVEEGPEPAAAMLEAMAQWPPEPRERLRVRPPLAIFAGEGDARWPEEQAAANTIERVRLLPLTGITTSSAVAGREPLLGEALAFFRASRRGGEQPGPSRGRGGRGPQREGYGAGPQGYSESPAGEHGVAAETEQGAAQAEASAPDEATMAAVESPHERATAPEASRGIPSDSDAAVEPPQDLQDTAAASAERTEAGASGPAEPMSADDERQSPPHETGVASVEGAAAQEATDAVSDPEREIKRNAVTANDPENQPGESAGKAGQSAGPAHREDPDGQAAPAEEESSG